MWPSSGSSSATGGPSDAEADHLSPPVLESSYWRGGEYAQIHPIFSFQDRRRSRLLLKWPLARDTIPQGVDEFVILLHLQSEATGSVQIVCGFSGAANARQPMVNLSEGKLQLKICFRGLLLEGLGHSDVIWGLFVHLLHAHPQPLTVRKARFDREHHRKPQKTNWNE